MFNRWMLGLAAASLPWVAHAQAMPGSSLFDIDTRPPAPARKTPAAPKPPAEPKSTAEPKPVAEPKSPAEAPAEAPARPARAARQAPQRQEVRSPSPADAATTPPQPAVPAARTIDNDAGNPRTGAGVAGGTASSGAARGRAPALDGRWADRECVALDTRAGAPNLYVRRQYEFVEARRGWKLEASVHSTRDCADRDRLFTYQGSGQYVVAGPARSGAGAWDATMTADRWTAVPVNRAGVLALFNGRCGTGDFDEGRPLDMSRTGCRPLGIRAARRGESATELVRIADNRLFVALHRADGSVDESTLGGPSYGMTRQR